MILRDAFNKFPDFFLYRHLQRDDRPIFLILGSNKQLQQQLEYTLLKPDSHK